MGRERQDEGKILHIIAHFFISRQYGTALQPVFKRLGDDPLCTEALTESERKASSLAPSLQGELPNAQWAQRSPYGVPFPSSSLGSVCPGCLPSLPAEGSVHVGQATKLAQPQERDPSIRKKRTQQPPKRGLDRKSPRRMATLALGI